MHIPAQVVLTVAGSRRARSAAVRQLAAGARSRLAFWFGAAILIAVFLTRASVAGAQGTEASRLWQPAKVVKAEPKKAEAKPAAAKAPAKVAEKAQPAPSVDSSAILLAQRLEQLERATREQSAVISALQSRLDSAGQDKPAVVADTVVPVASADSVVADTVASAKDSAATPASDSASAEPRGRRG